MKSMRGIEPRRTVSAIIALFVITIGLALPLFSAGPVAAATLALTPASGPVGTSVAADMAGISGQWYLAWDSEAGSVITGGTTSSTALTRYFTVPTTSGGTHTIYLVSEGGSGNATFTILPSIAVSPTTAAKGATVSVSGNGYGASETGITIALAGAPVQSGITADANGTWSSSFTMPASPGGALSLTASGSTTSAGATNTAQITVIPSIALGTNSGIVGSTVTITGTSFRASETGVTITWDTSTNLGTPTVDATGSFTAKVTIPETTAGNHTISAYGSISTTTEVGNQTFQVRSGISVQPESAEAGSSVTIKGSGFAANETGITVLFDGKQIASGLTASGTGSWTTSYTLPAMAGGAKSLSAAGAVTSASTISPATFTVTSKIVTTASQGKVGSEITMEGTSFGANDSITILVDGQPAAGVQPFSADGNGAWKATFKMPEAPTGAHQLSARGAAITAPKPLGFTVDPDAAISPDNGNVGTTIKVTGTGFAAGRPVSVKYDTDSIAGTFTTNAAGTFSVSFAAPKSKGGAHKVTVSDGATSREFNWEMEKTAPPAPKLTTPEDGSYPNGFDGLFGDIIVDFKWGKVEDPSGVTYVFQLARDEAFSAEKMVANVTTDNLTFRVGPLPLTDFPLNNYYWRVKAVDGASNESAWAKVQSFHSGVMPVWGFGVVGVIILGLCTWGILWSLKRSAGPREPRYRPEKEPRYRPEREPKAPARPARKPARREPEEEDYPPLDEEAPVGPPEADDIDSFVAQKVAGLTDNEIPQLAKRKDMAARGLTAPAIYKAIARLEMNGTISRTDEGRYVTGMLGARRHAEPELIDTEEEPAPPPVPPKSKAPAARPAAKPAPRPEPAPEPAPAATPQEIDATLLKALDGVTESDLPQVAQRPDIQDLGLNLSKLYRQVDRLKSEGKLPVDGRGRFTTGSRKKDEGEDLVPEMEELPDRPQARAAAPSPARAPAPVEPADEAGLLVLRTVGGLDADGVTDLPMRPEYQKLGLNLARVYKTIARLEQEGKVSKDHRGRYQVKGAPPVVAEAAPEPVFEPAPPPPPARDPDEEMVLKAIIGITDADVTQLAQSPEMKARGLNLSRLYKVVSKLDKEGKMVRDNRGRFQLPGQAPATPEAAEPPSSDWDRPAKPPAYKPTEVTAGLDLRDPYEDTVFNAVIGQSDADVTLLVNSEAMKLRGLTLARIYKITARLEKEGKLVRDEKGRYQKAASRGPSTSATAFDSPSRQAPAPAETDILRPAVEFDAAAVEGLVADVMEGLSATDIPSVAKNEALKARGVTLARLFSLCAKLEREGKLVRDEKGKYHKPGSGEAKAV